MWFECCYHHSSLLTWGAENLLVWELNCYCTTGWCSMGEWDGAATFTSLSPCKLHLWAIQRHRHLYLRNHKHPTVSHMSFRIMSGTNKSDTYLPFGHNNSDDKTWEWGGLLQHKVNSSQQLFCDRSSCDPGCMHLKYAILWCSDMVWLLYFNIIFTIMDFTYCMWPICNPGALSILDAFGFGQMNHYHRFIKINTFMLWPPGV